MLQPEGRNYWPRAQARGKSGKFLSPRKARNHASLACFHQLFRRSTNRRASSKTLTNISRVNFPVFVFWFEG